MVYIIVLNWNGWRDTIECVESILRQKFSNYRIIICDNQSSDNSVLNIGNWINGLSAPELFIGPKDPIPPAPTQAKYQYVDYDDKANFSPNADHRISIIQTGENRGYGAGNNVGIEFALLDPKMDSIWILNNDLIVDYNTLSCLYQFHCDHPQLGIIGSKLMFYDRPSIIQAIGGSYNPVWATSSHIGAYQEDRGQYDYDAIIAQIDYPVGASLFVTKEYIRSVGLLSEEYFLYFEEIDWIRRGNTMGWKFGYCWSAKVFHKEGSSAGSHSNPALKSETADYYALTNRVRFTRKYHSRWIWTVKIGLLIAAVNRVRRCQFKRLKIIAKALGN